MLRLYSCIFFILNFLSFKIFNNVFLTSIFIFACSILRYLLPKLSFIVTLINSILVIPDNFCISNCSPVLLFNIELKDSGLVNVLKPIKSAIIRIININFFLFEITDLYIKSANLSLFILSIFV